MFSKTQAQAQAQAQAEQGTAVAGDSSGDDEQTKKLQQIVEKLQQQRAQQNAEQQQAQQQGVCIQLEERAAVYAGRAKCGASFRYEEEPPDLWQRMAEASFKIAATAAAV